MGLTTANAAGKSTSTDTSNKLPKSQTWIILWLMMSIEWLLDNLSKFLVILVRVTVFILVIVVALLHLFDFQWFKIFNSDVASCLLFFLLLFLLLVLLVGHFIQLNYCNFTIFSMRSYVRKVQTGLISSRRVFRKASLHAGLKLTLRSFSATTHAKNL